MSTWENFSLLCFEFKRESVHEKRTTLVDAMNFNGNIFYVFQATGNIKRKKKGKTKKMTYNRAKKLTFVYLVNAYVLLYQMRLHIIFL